jgi:hypothetical protein
MVAGRAPALAKMLLVLREIMGRSSGEWCK